MATKFSSNPLGFFRGVRQVAQLAKQAQKVPEAQKTAWREDMHKNRWKYFLRTHLFIAVCVLFLWLGSTLKYKMGIIEWHIWMGMSSIFLIAGIFIWFYYLWLIVKNEK